MSVIVGSSKQIAISATLRQTTSGTSGKRSVLLRSRPNKLPCFYFADTTLSTWSADFWIYCAAALMEAVTFAKTIFSLHGVNSLHHTSRFLTWRWEASGAGVASFPQESRFRSLFQLPEEQWPWEGLKRGRVQFASAWKSVHCSHRWNKSRTTPCLRQSFACFFRQSLPVASAHFVYRKQGQRNLSLVAEAIRRNESSVGPLTAVMMLKLGRRFFKKSSLKDRALSMVSTSSVFSSSGIREIFVAS